MSTDNQGFTAVRPTYARDLWDARGLKAITQRIDSQKKSMKQLQSFFHDSAKAAFNQAQVYGKLSQMNVSDSEVGTLKFSLDRFAELIETMSKNDEILGSKFRTNCANKLADQIKRFDKINNKLLSEINALHKSCTRETKSLNKAKQTYDQKKQAVIAARTALQLERDRLISYQEKQLINKIPQAENNIISLQNKAQHLNAQSREALDFYLKSIAHYRGFRLKFDSQTSMLLDQLEQTERERAKTVHKLLTVYLDIQLVMVKQSQKNIETIAQHISKLNPDADNSLFVERNKSNRVRPPLPNPILHPDDHEEKMEVVVELNEESPEVQKWCEKWRLVIANILKRDVDLSLSNSDSKAGFVNLTDAEYSKVKNECLESVHTPTGRMAFALLLNRQRNADHGNGLELKREEFLELVELVRSFFDAVHSSKPVDVKAAKLVMIMTQSLYCKKVNVLDLLTQAEMDDFERTKTPVAKNSEKKMSFSEKSSDKEPENTITFVSSASSDSIMDGTSHPLADTVENGEVTNKENEHDNLAPNESKEETEKTLKDHARNASYLPKSNKLFLVDRIKNHEVWKSEQFWKEAFIESVQQELKKYPPIQKWHSEQEQLEGDRRNKQIIFSQMAAYMHNMKEFGMDNKSIVRFLESQHIPVDQKLMLKATIGIVDEVLEGDEEANGNNHSTSPPT